MATHATYADRAEISVSGHNQIFTPANRWHHIQEWECLPNEEYAQHLEQWSNSFPHVLCKRDLERVKSRQKRKYLSISNDTTDGVEVSVEVNKHGKWKKIRRMATIKKPMYKHGVRVL
jgi:ribosomal protein L21